MLTDKEQSFKIHRGNVFHSKILHIAKLSRIKQLPVTHTLFFQKGELQKNEQVKNNNNNNHPLQNEKQKPRDSGDGGANTEKEGEGDLQADDRHVLLTVTQQL